MCISLGILIGGRISGAHFNPVVTVALVLNKKSSRRLMPAYLIGEFVGAFIGAFFSYVFIDEVESPYYVITTWRQVFIAIAGECLGTAIIVYFVLWYIFN
jgi:glycerol uptake facilitator-like aquaporin